MADARVVAEKESASGEGIGDLTERTIAKAATNPREQIGRLRFARDHQDVGAKIVLQPLCEGQPAIGRPVLFWGAAAGMKGHEPRLRHRRC